MEPRQVQTRSEVVTGDVVVVQRVGQDVDERDEGVGCGHG
jgi:hypothetical protein